MSFYKTKAFHKLNKAWQKKLAKSGFEDIEVPDSPREMLKRWHGYDFKKGPFAAAKFEAKATYFQNAAWFLEHHIFETSLEKRVWAGHADGLSLIEVAKKLKISKSKAYTITRRLKELLACK